MCKTILLILSVALVACSGNSSQDSELPESRIPELQSDIVSSKDGISLPFPSGMDAQIAPDSDSWDVDIRHDAVHEDMQQDFGEDSRDSNSEADITPDVATDTSTDVSDVQIGEDLTELPEDMMHQDIFPPDITDTLEDLEDMNTPEDCAGCYAAGTCSPFCLQLAIECGQDIEVRLREDWGAPLLNQNPGLDVSDSSAVMNAIADGNYPPHPIWPETGDYPDAYDVGDMMCTIRGLCWGWNTLDWPANSHDPFETTQHHSATTLSGGNCDDHVRSIANFHTFTNGWGDIGYNLLICKDSQGVHYYEGRWPGNVPGRPWASAVGAHVAGQNTDNLGIMLVGNFESEVPDADQIAALKAIHARIRYEYSMAPGEIQGHRDVAATACPGANLSPQLHDLRQHTVLCEQNGF